MNPDRRYLIARGPGDRDGRKPTPGFFLPPPPPHPQTTAALEKAPAAPGTPVPAPPSHWVVGQPHWQREVLAGSWGRDPPTSAAPSVQSSHPPQAGAAAPSFAPGPLQRGQ